MAQGDLHTVDGINGRIAGRRAAQRRDPRIGHKTHVHQMILHGLGKVQRQQDTAFPDC